MGALVIPLIEPLFRALFKELLSGLLDWFKMKQAHVTSVALGRTKAAAESSEAARKKEEEYAEIGARPVTNDDLLGRLSDRTF